MKFFLTKTFSEKFRKYFLKKFCVPFFPFPNFSKVIFANCTFLAKLASHTLFLCLSESMS